MNEDFKPEADAGPLWESAISTSLDSKKALQECVGKVRKARPAPPDLAFLFVSPHHSGNYAKLPAELSRNFPGTRIAGCSGGGIIGGGQEAEDRPALSLLCAWLPGVRLQLFRLTQKQMPSPDAPPQAWRDWTGVPAPEARGGLILMADPFSLDAEAMVRGLDYAYPGVLKIGGMASGAQKPGENALFIDGKASSRGGVGLAVAGAMRIEPIVAQGCRPVGEPCVVTEARGHQLFLLDGKPAAKRAAEVLSALDEPDRRMARLSLFIGVPGDSTRAGDPEPDFLVRNVIGVDPKTGALAVGAELRHGQLIRFYVRDGRTASADLAEQINRYKKRDPSGRTVGALLFSCLGRGQGLYGKANHDSDMLFHELGALPLGGFFCSGEVGPVEGSTYLHGFTSCFALFRPVNKT